MTIGKDGRHLSTYQEPAWMHQIAKNRKYLNQAKGEKNGNTKLTEGNVRYIREHSANWRKYICNHFNISERHWYSIRARKKWKHI